MWLDELTRDFLKLFDSARFVAGIRITSAIFVDFPAELEVARW
jgi:hypothetical protein